jgi:arylsulfatase A-like enzyme
MIAALSSSRSGAARRAARALAATSPATTTWQTPRTLMLLAIVVAAMTAGACGGEQVEPPRNLIIITVDTLRADHMSLYGYPRRTTPSIDAFAERAVTFDRAIAPWPKTAPSMVSMFSGRYPHTTGVMFASRGLFVADQQLMLAEVAQQNGLLTGAVVSNAVLGSSTNFQQGFNNYVETYQDESPYGDEQRNRANSVTFHARFLLRDLAPEGPFFLWAHYVDPHTRYDPPPEYAEPFFNDSHYDATELRLNDDDQNFHGGVAGKYWRQNGGQAEAGWYTANYDGEIAFADDQIGELLAEIERLGLLENSVVMITADHGESLGEHQYFFEHGWFPYHACGWIPWVVYWPDNPSPGRRIEHPSGLLNLMPTVLDLMGWDDVPADLFHGHSVMPVMLGEEEYTERYVVEEAGEGGLRRDQFLRSIQDRQWKLVQVPSQRYRDMMQGVEFELYDVLADPMETTNLADAHPDIVERMRTALDEVMEATGPVAPPPGQAPLYTEEQLRQLRALGYIR